MRRPATTLAGVIALTAGALVAPQVVLGHQLVGRVESPLPLVAYLAGAALAVALSFAFVILRDVRAPAHPRSSEVIAPRWLTLGLRAIGLLGWSWIVAQTIIGGPIDEADVAVLFLWIYGWVGVAFVSALVGPIWRWLDPFSTLYDLGAATLRRLGFRGWEPSPYPAGLGLWPAVAGLAFFVWLELAYKGGGLGVVVIGYTVLTLLAMASFGRDAWRTNGETFSVWFGTLNRLAPFGSLPAEVAPGPADRSLVRRPYATGLLAGDWAMARVALVAVGVGSILYDGLSQTQAWFDAFGAPFLPLATVELLAWLALIVGVALIVGRVVGLPAVGGGLVPIAIGYLIAHYLTYILGDGQRLVVALSDPFQQGWNLLGFAAYEPGIGWIPPVLLWAVMLLAVVGGHVVGAWSGHVLAVSGQRATSTLRLRQVPLAALMVALTATTLWSLGQTIVKEPPESTSAALIAHAAAGAAAGPAQVAAPPEDESLLVGDAH
ncbi:MAG TPA: hypothetical protein VJ506_03970 [Candidatus Limnocylindrales bacterium]|nr:hypothetical protein [Candidatus Limnocylindrales bacterium]